MINYICAAAALGFVTIGMPALALAGMVGERLETSAKRGRHRLREVHVEALRRWRGARRGAT